MDVLQKEGDLVVRVEMPGVKPEDVHVAVHNRVLTISGERKVDEEEERAGYYVKGAAPRLIPAEHDLARRCR